MHCYLEGVEANKMLTSLSPHHGVCVWVCVRVSTLVHRPKQEKHMRQRQRRTNDRTCVFACSVVMHMFMHWFYEFSIKCSEGWHWRPWGILSLEASVQSSCLLTATALTTATTRHPHTECTNTNFSVSTASCLYLFIPSSFFCFKPFVLTVCASVSFLAFFSSNINPAKIKNLNSLPSLLA